MKPLNDIINRNRSYINCSDRMEDGNNNNDRNRKRKVIWFNNTFCKLSIIYIGRYFLNLIDKHFHRDNPLNTIFNINTVKINYSCTDNISKIIYN